MKKVKVAKVPIVTEKVFSEEEVKELENVVKSMPTEASFQTEYRVHTDSTSSTPTYIKEAYTLLEDFKVGNINPTTKPSKWATTKMNIQDQRMKMPMPKFVGNDPVEDDGDYLESDNQMPKSRSKLTKKSLGIQEQRQLAYTKYLEDPTQNNFLRFLIKHNLLRESSHPISYSNIGLNLQESNYLTNILEDFYHAKGGRVIYVTIDNEHIYLNILKECAKKEISIDKDLKDLNLINFKNLNNMGVCLYLAYSTTLKELLFMTNDLNNPIFNYSLHKFEECIEEIDNINKTNIDHSVININGKDYSKHIIESLIESDFDTFLLNLEIETVLDTNNIADVVVDKVTEAF